MRKFWTCLALAAVMLLGVVARPASAADEKAVDKPLDLTNVIGKTDAPGASVDELPPGDGKAFTSKTDDDLSLLETGAVYKTSNSGEKTYFKVSAIPSQSPTGGEVVFARISGKGELPETLTKHQGKGPETIKKRVTAMDYFFMGGFTMYGIATLAFITIALAINGVWLYWPSRHVPGAYIEKSRALLRNGDVKGFRDLSMNTKGLLASLGRAMTTDFANSTLDDIKERVEVAASARITSLRFPVKVLNLIAAAAPLVGLFGTIYGMMVVFAGVENATGAAKATTLAAGIKMKLVCTAAALVVAIPALFSYFLYNSILSSIIARCELIAEQFMHRLALIKRAGGGDDVSGTDEPAAKPAATNIKKAIVQQDDDETEEVVVVRKKKKPQISEEEAE